MSKEKNPLIQIAGQIESVVTEISVGLKERGISIVETIGKLAQPNGKKTIRKIVAACADLFIEMKICFLKSAEQNIKISSPAFSKKSLLDSEDGVKILTGSNFDVWILPEISDAVPEFNGTFSSFDLTKEMTDDEIRSEKGEDTLTPNEWLAKTRALVLKQPNSENGHLATNYKSNIDYVRLKSGRVVAVFVLWLAGRRAWFLSAYVLADHRWHDGHRVFARG